MTKVEYLRKNFPNLDIEVDGGVGPNTVEVCAQVNDKTQTYSLVNMGYSLSRINLKASN